MTETADYIISKIVELSREISETMFVQDIALYAAMVFGAIAAIGLVCVVLNKNGIEICNLYSRGMTRTGCAFCGFGIMQDPQRFILLKTIYPDLWAYCMKPFDKGGLGMREVLEFIGIPTGFEQKTLIEFDKDVKE